jgi:hypothetical protein
MHPVLLFRQHHQPQKFQKRFVLLKLVEYIVLLPFSFGLILLSEWIQEEEDMDRRPKPRIWSGEDYESDPDEVEHEKADTKNSNLTAHMR